MRWSRLGSGIASAAIGLLATSHLAAAQTRSPVCAGTQDRQHDTVIVYQPPSTFTICRGGAAQNDVVAGRPVYFEVARTAGSGMFDFRIHGQATEWTATGLRAWHALVRRVTRALHTMADASEPISSLAIPPETASSSASPLRPVAAARARYLGEVTREYREALMEGRVEAPDLPVAAGAARKWCGELEQAGGLPMGPELHARCSGAELREGVIDHELEAFEEAAGKFDAARTRAREATMTAIARPEDGTAVSDAVKALDAARGAAASTLAAAQVLRSSSAQLGRDVATLRAVVRSQGAVQPGAPTYLATFATPGNAELEIDVSPVDIDSADDDASRNAAGKTTARFPIVGRHYLDLEAGLGFTAGLPQIPTLLTQSGSTTVQGRPVDEFVGLALLELEPARFLWPDQPLAGVLRLPVLGVPFTRDPTQNFFVGAALGWTGVGSITAGPYLLRELTLKEGLTTGQTLPAGTLLEAVAEPVLQVGYFVSASVDLLGLFHVFFPEHAPVIDATTGKEK